MNPLNTIKGTIIAGFVLALVLGVLSNVVTKKGASTSAPAAPAAMKTK